MNILKYSFLTIFVMMLFSYGCRKDIKAIEDFYTYIDIHDYARDTLGLPRHLLTDSINGLHDCGIYIKIDELGEGLIPKTEDSLSNPKLYVYYKGRLLTGKQFSEHEMYKKDESGNFITDENGELVIEMPFSFYVDYGNVIRGWDIAFTKIPRGTKATFLIPSELAYGNVTQTRIPPNSPLRFDVELLWLVGDPEKTANDVQELNEDNINKSGPNIEISRMLGLIE